MNAEITDKQRLDAFIKAADIHRRAMTLAALWTAFDPYGVVVYDLRQLEDRAFQLRDYLNMDDLDLLADAPMSPVREVAEGKDVYGTFLNHLRGIETAIRRFKRLPVSRGEVTEYKVRLILLAVAELKARAM